MAITRLLQYIKDLLDFGQLVPPCTTNLTKICYSACETREHASEQKWPLDDINDFFLKLLFSDLPFLLGFYRLFQPLSYAFKKSKIMLFHCFPKLFKCWATTRVSTYTQWHKMPRKVNVNCLNSNRAKLNDNQAKLAVRIVITFVPAWL